MRLRVFSCILVLSYIIPKDLYILVDWVYTMSEERIVEIKGRLDHLERVMMPLQFDLSRKQINEFHKQKLVRLEKERSDLSSELEELRGD